MDSMHVILETRERWAEKWTWYLIENRQNLKLGVDVTIQAVRTYEFRVWKQRAKVKWLNERGANKGASKAWGRRNLSTTWCSRCHQGHMGVYSTQVNGDPGQGGVCESLWINGGSSWHHHKEQRTPPRAQVDDEDHSTPSIPKKTSPMLSTLPESVCLERWLVKLKCI